MNGRPRASIALVAALAVFAAAAPVAAQHAQVLQPTPADPEHPATQVAIAVSDALLSGNAAVAAARIAPLAAPAWRDGAMERDVGAQLLRVGPPGRYRFDTVLLGPPDALVVLLRAVSDSTQVLGFMVSMDMEAPHEVTGLRSVELRKHGQ